jgi:hypothetical protein
MLVEGPPSERHYRFAGAAQANFALLGFWEVPDSSASNYVGVVIVDKFSSDPVFRM